MVKNKAKPPGKNSRGAELERGLAVFKPLSAEQHVFLRGAFPFQPEICVFLQNFQKTSKFVKKSEKKRP